MNRRRPHPILWIRAHPGIADGLLAVLLTTLGVVFHLTNAFEIDADAYDIREPTWWSPVLVVGAMLPIAWRRTQPLAVVVVVTTVQCVFSALDFDGTGFLGVIVAIYSVGAHSSGRARTRTLAFVALLLGGLFVLGLALEELDLANLISSTIVLVTAVVLGDNLRRRRDAAAALADRADRAERERELIAERRVGDERARIARELHDVVAHSVSVMVIQAGAARRNLRSSPDAAEEALAAIESTGRQTMNELRAILGVLRTSAAATDERRAPQPTLDDVERLVETADDLPVHARIDDDLAELPASVALTGYRVVQEALTNIRRHAGDVGRVDVVVARSDRSLTITIDDDGRGAAADATLPGYGLVGMRERVSTIGGRIVAGPRPGGGWRVVAELPTGAGVREPVG